MAIRFHCSGCGQPIEVDDEHAEQAAECPYCQRVVTVPAKSTLDTHELPRAREVPVPPAPPPPLHVGQVVMPHAAAARSFGNYGLICTALALLCLIAQMAVFAPLILEQFEESARNPGAPANSNRLNEAMQEKVESTPWLLGLSCGLPFFALVGFVMGLVGIIQSRAREWRGWVSAGICGSFLFCALISIILSVVGAGLAV
jgi:DNA-directed RNA polymerase subunit RPC12/RpoP